MTTRPSSRRSLTTASARAAARRRAAASLALACFALVLVCLAATPAARAAAHQRQRRDAPKRLLVVTVTKGFRHDSIPTAEEVLGKMADASKIFTVDYARTDEEMAAKMSPDGLKRYDAVFFANTTGNLLIPDRDAFIKWIADGHGFLGAHAATDTYPDFPAYIQMIGGQFRTHGPQVEVECRVEDHKHPATKDFASGSFKVFDEIYLFKNFDRSRVHGLLTLDAHPNDKTPGDYPVAWTRHEGKGRVFYTSLGHRKDIWNAEWYQKHLMGGIRWALGLEKGDDKPQRK